MMALTVVLNMGGGGRGDTLSLNDENYAVVNDTEDALWRYC